MTKTCLHSLLQYNDYEVQQCSFKSTDVHTNRCFLFVLFYRVSGTHVAQKVIVFNPVLHLIFPQNPSHLASAFVLKGKGILPTEGQIGMLKIKENLCLTFYHNIVNTLACTTDYNARYKADLKKPL